MPTYDYRCSECLHEFEYVQSMMDKPLEICPKCEGKVKRLISKNVGISFKGSGFYVTDSKSSSSVSQTKTETKKESTPASTPVAAETKKEAAPKAA